MMIIVPCLLRMGIHTATFTSFIYSLNNSIEYVRHMVLTMDMAENR